MAKCIKRLRERLAGRTGLMIHICAVCLVFLFCALVPMAFRGEIIDDSVFDSGARAAMFSRYMEKNSDVRVKVDEKPGTAEIKYCTKVFDGIYDRCVLDVKDGKLITQGQEFMTLSDGENSMRLCRMWVQDQGDWTNWLDVYIDAETGFVFYLYVSSICLSNSMDYSDSLDPGFNCKTVADVIAAETGYGLEMLSWSGRAEDTATAYTYSDGEAIIWSINCSYYPSSMLDLKICVA